jgi:hypothetical protein
LGEWEKNKIGMKNRLKSVFVLMGMIVTSHLMAQQTLPPQPNHLYVNGGFSVAGILFKTLLNGDSVKYSVQNKPAIQFGYDHSVNEWLSLGAGFSNQKFQITFSEYIDDNNVLQTGDFNADLTRNHVHFKALAGKFTERYSIYGGLRLGYVWFLSDLSMEKREMRAFDKIDQWLSLGRPTLGIPVGGRFYFSDYVGLNMEFNLGAPHILSAGVSIKF